MAKGHEEVKSVEEVPCSQYRTDLEMVHLNKKTTTEKVLV